MFSLAAAVRSTSLAALALWAVAQTGGASAVPGLADFKSDGCSLFPDGSYYSCCYVHDFAYWPGGTEDERKSADKELRECVRGITGSRLLAGVMYLGVRLGGGPGHHTTFRWGFGWPYPYRNEYGPLTPDERRQVAEKSRELCASLRSDPVNGGYFVDGDKKISAAQAERICPDLAAARATRPDRPTP